MAKYKVVTMPDNNEKTIEADDVIESGAFKTYYLKGEEVYQVNKAYVLSSERLADGNTK